MEFSLDSTKINMIKQGISSVNKGLIDRKAALGDPKLNPKPDPLVIEHIDDLVHACGEAYLIFSNLQEQNKEGKAIKFKTIE